ncbi:MAG: MFS transporter [Gammaproteobacteria bacterium]|nr:MAG: MFS transporter [Gammaproteobacteria bacterium]
MKIKKSVVLVVCVAIFFSVLNASGVTVILPEMRTAYDINTMQLSWVMSIYLLTYGIAIPFYGRIADKFGARPLFLIGITLFFLGSLACFAAPNFKTMLAARILQAAGGAAFPGLGMAIASRAFSKEKRGIAIGILSATMGVGSAIGPLVTGIITEFASWRGIFGVSALVIFVLPFAWMVLPRDEEQSNGKIDIIGGTCLALVITGLLYAVSQSTQSGWTDPIVLAAMTLSVAGLIGLTLRQRSSHEPFIPNELIKNIRYLRIIFLAFLVAAVNLAAIIGFPLMLAKYNGLDTFQIGLVMFPGAIAAAICGILAGRLVDRVGPRLPTRLGASIMLLTMVSLSFLSGGSVMIMMTLAGFLGAGFALLNTPIAAVVSAMVRSTNLASALSLNTMMYFIGGSLGAALFSSIVTSNSDSLAAWNPLYSGTAIGYSDAFGVLAIGIALAIIIVVPLPTKKMVEAEKAKQVAMENWTPDCSMPWAPELKIK